jgi:malate dehydrogenase (oxaloacetate-decarboxylating)
MVDSRGIIYAGRTGLNKYKKEIAKETNKKKMKGKLEDVLKGADIFIGVSRPNIATRGMIRSMADKAIVFAMSNPDPEISVKDAKAGGAAIIATGRSDYPNQINNVLVFPGIFKGALEARAKKITDKMNLSAAKALAGLIKKPSANRIIPGVFDKGVADRVAKAVKKNI